MGSNLNRKSVHNGFVIHTDTDRLRKIFQNIYVYCSCTYSVFNLAGEPTQNVGIIFVKSYCGVLLEGAVIILACIIFSLYASSPPQVDTSAAAVTMVWKYVGELVFNMLVLVGTVKMSDRIIHEMMGM